MITGIRTRRSGLDMNIHEQELLLCAILIPCHDIMVTVFTIK